MQCPLKQRPHTQYRGRFAPSPSGLLHFGSLVTALASYLDAKHNNGIWLVRIEDIDPPRELAGASKTILSTLENYGLYWDEPVLFQSKQNEIYQEVLAFLDSKLLSYNCQCTRATIKAMGGIYLGHCRHLNLPPHNSATRVINSVGHYTYQDSIQGSVLCPEQLSKEDFIVKRKDGLFAYQLAVVIDEIFQGISHVIRGCDLLDPTARQLSFFEILNCTAPQYGHVPLAVTDEGYKLSKQNNAPAIDVKHPQPSLIAALAFLGQQPDASLVDGTVDEIINWAINHWKIDNVPRKHEIQLIR